MDQLNQDFLTFIELLEKENVDYLVVGGYAVGLHGFPRYTGDIDFFVKISEENASRILKVFDEFGFGGIGLSLGDFLEENFVVEIGREPRKIQVFTGIDGVTFNECFQRKIEATIGRMNVKFIGKEDLIMNKAASGRSKDRIDLEELKKL
jgi:predicted nucleotidyltransferase